MTVKNCCKKIFWFLAQAKSFDAESIRLTEHVLTFKAQAAVAVSITAFVLNFTSGHYLMDLVDEMIVSTNENMNVDFVKTVLPFIKVT